MCDSCSVKFSRKLVAMLLLFHFPHKNGYEIPEKPSKRKNITNVHCYQCERSSGLEKIKFESETHSFFIFVSLFWCSTCQTCPHQLLPVERSLQRNHSPASCSQAFKSFTTWNQFENIRQIFPCHHIFSGVFTAKCQIHYHMKTHTKIDLKNVWICMNMYQLVSMHSRYSALDVIGDSSDSSRVRPMDAMAPHGQRQARHTHRHHRHRPPVGTCEVARWLRWLRDVF